MIDSEEFGHGGPTVVQVLEDTWVALAVWVLVACRDTVGGARRGQEVRGATRPDS